MPTSNDPVPPASAADRLTEKWTPDARDARIRDKAYEIWIEEGKPSWQQERHWDMAARLVAAEDEGRTAHEEVAVTESDGKDAAVDIAGLAKRHGVSEDAVQTVLDAVRRGGGTMAQFSHPDFGGMAQWTKGGMTMVGDMFNDRLKARLNDLASELAAALASQPQRSAGPDASTTRSAPAGTWWPSDLGEPGSAGAQNDMRYAIFPDKRRLAIDDNGRISVYDTAEHRISGISQAQSGQQTLTFSGQNGLVSLADLKKIG